MVNESQRPATGASMCSVAQRFHCQDSLYILSPPVDLKSGQLEPFILCSCSFTPVYSDAAALFADPLPASHAAVQLMIMLGIRVWQSFQHDGIDS